MSIPERMWSWLESTNCLLAWESGSFSSKTVLFCIVKPSLVAHCCSYLETHSMVTQRGWDFVHRQGRVDFAGCSFSTSGCKCFMKKISIPVEWLCHCYKYLPNSSITSLSIINIGSIHQCLSVVLEWENEGSMPIQNFRIFGLFKCYFRIIQSRKDFQFSIQLADFLKIRISLTH